MIDVRAQELNTWINSQVGVEAKITAISGDASFRRYFRAEINSPKFPQSLILMDAPPAKENCQPFINVAEILTEGGVNAPQIYCSDLEKGFLALSDFGDITYENYLNKNINSANELYNLAFKTLIKIQQIAKPAVPAYSHAKLLEELNLFPHWFLQQHLQVDFDANKLFETFELLIKGYTAQAQVLVHRDYHIRNLMVVGHEKQINMAQTPAVLDFQDAVVGPITYDAVSLLRDAYIYWDEEITLDWLIRYWQEAKNVGLPVDDDFSTFYYKFDLMILQRHIKVLGIFARLNYRDGKSRYLEYLPLVFTYCQKVVNRYSELRVLAKLFEKIESKVLPTSEQKQVGYTF